MSANTCVLWPPGGLPAPSCRICSEAYGAGEDVLALACGLPLGRSQPPPTDVPSLVALSHHGHVECMRLWLATSSRGVSGQGKCPYEGCGARHAPPAPRAVLAPHAPPDACLRDLALSPDRRVTLELLKKIFANALPTMGATASPTNASMRRLRKGNASIAALLAVPGASGLLSHFGWRTDEEGTLLLLPDAVDPTTLAAQHALLASVTDALHALDAAAVRVSAGSALLVAAAKRREEEARERARVLAEAEEDKERRRRRNAAAAASAAVSPPRTGGGGNGTVSLALVDARSPAKRALMEVLASQTLGDVILDALRRGTLTGPGSSGHALPLASAVLASSFEGVSVSYLTTSLTGPALATTSLDAFGVHAGGSAALRVSFPVPAAAEEEGGEEEEGD